MFFQVLGTTILGLVQQRYGMFPTRLTAGILTTFGLIFFIFYDKNPFLLYPGMAFSKLFKIFKSEKVTLRRSVQCFHSFLVSTPALTYLVTNMAISPVFPSISSGLAVLFTGIFDVASSVFLWFKERKFILFETSYYFRPK